MLGLIGVAEMSEVTKCWFCQDAVAIDTFVVRMIKTEGTRVYAPQNVGIPICADCKKAHGTAGKAMVLAVVLFSLLFVPSLTIFLFLPSIITGIIFGACLVLALFLGFRMMKGNRNTAWKHGIRDFPRVVELQKNGFRVG